MAKRGNSESETAITPAKAEGTLAILRLEDHQIQEALSEIAGSSGISRFDLPRVKIPAGGGIAWEIPSVSGEPNVSKSFEGVILLAREGRVYWQDAFGDSDGAKPPDCSSDDAVHAVGVMAEDENVQGFCERCPMSKFGTAVKQNGERGRGQACKKVRVLFILPVGSIVPMILVCPPTSEGAAKRYGLGLLGEFGLGVSDVVTRFTLETAANADGIKYSKVNLAYVSELTDDERVRVKAMKQALTPASIAQVVSRDEVDG